MDAQSKAVIIRGPQGCGKTRNAEALAKHFGKTLIIDDWKDGEPLPDNALCLTQDAGEHIHYGYERIAKKLGLPVYVLDEPSTVSAEREPASHTPGPWHVGSHRSIESAAGTICETYSWMGTEEADDNEKLIAAAPCLLKAAQQTYNEISTHGQVTIETWESLSAAINKAMGVA